MYLKKNILCASLVSVKRKINKQKKTKTKSNIINKIIYLKKKNEI